jgi:DNA-binding IclR family transcriptional regulator
VVKPFVDRVFEECGEVSFYCMYLPATHRVIAVYKVEARDPLRYTFQLYEPMSIMWGATGRSVLAHLPESEVAALIEEGEPSPATGAPLPPAPKLLADLAKIRERGYAITFGQKIKGAVGTSAPVLAGNRQPVGSLCVTIPEYRFERKMEPKISALVVREAARLSQEWGKIAGSQGSRPQLPRRAV